MKEIVYVFLGGGVGSVLRYLVSTYASKHWNYQGFPVGTFLVNLLGCLLMGMLVSYIAKGDSMLKFLLIVGFCGGFTTFSTFSLENWQLFQNGQYITLSLYIILSIILGILAVFVGMEITK